MMDKDTERTQLRSLLRQRRRQLTAQQQAAAAQAICSTLTLHPAITQATTIAYYLNFDGEVDLSPFADWCQQQNKQLCLPVLDPNNPGHLLFVLHSEETVMQANVFGIPEPALTDNTILNIDQLDVILLPLVGFDHKANRLGMGGGFYDRTLAQWHQQRHPQTALIGIAHHCQEVEKLPIMPWDVPLDQVVTDRFSDFSGKKP